MSENKYSHYELLIKKLQGFISKYYLQQWVRGILQFALLFFSVYLITSTLEYNLYFSSTIRKVLFFIFSIGLALLAVYWVVVPMMRYVDNKKRINDKQAAKIIGKYFPEVEDKLLNVLYLHEMKDNSDSLELIQASIHQKSKSLVLVKFNDAIDWAKNRKLAQYLALPILLILGVLIFVPNLFKDSTYRLLNYDKTFTPKAPFEFTILNPSLKVPQFESIDIRARLSGKSIPNELNLIYAGVTYPMKLSEGVYHFTIQSVEKSSPFQLESMGFLSPEYQIDIVPKPVVSDFEVEIIPPAYTGQKSFSQKNIGDIQAPEGSMAIWKFHTNHVDNIKLQVANQSYQAEKFSNGFGLKLHLKKLDQYTIFVSNQQSPIIDSQKYAVSLTADAYPMISINEFKDSINEIQYYAGDVSDDYGVSALFLVINYGGKSYKHKVNIALGKNSSFHLSTFDIFKTYPKGADLNYYFEVLDNDQVNGAKSSKSATFHLKKLSEKELEKVVDKNTAQIQAELSQALKEAKQFQKELESVRKKLLEKSQLDFNDKKMLEELVKKQEEIQNKLENNKNEIQKNFEKKNELTNQEQSILEQQKQLEETIEQMKNPELQDLLKKINDLLEKADKKELLQNIEQMDNKSEKMEKNLDRLLQLYKNLDYKQKLNDMIDKLDALSKEQNKLSLESELEKNTLEKQKEETKQLEETKKKLEELNKLNNEVNKTDKKEFEDIKKDLDEAAEEQSEAEKELEKNDKKEGAEKQKKAADKMSDAKKKLQSLKAKQKKNQSKEDARMMRRLLENVIYLSFEQEKILEKTKNINTQAPIYTKTIQEQQRLKEDFKLIEDTLYKIASRQVKIRKFIFEEVDKVTNNTKSSILHMVERRPKVAISNQQYAMAAYNKLGLMISESLKNMEEDENEDENDSDNPQMCNNPKKGKKKKPGMSLEKLSQMQGQLNEQMEKLQQKMKEKAAGQQPNGDKNGKDGQGGKDGKDGKEAGEFAKIAAQQQAIRNALKKIEESSNSPDKSGKKPLGNGIQDAMDKMNQTEKDLVNKKIYEEMLRRQKEIQVKLLESAKAEREQDEENKRESERAKNIKPEIPSDLKQYLDNKKQNESQIQRNPVGLTPYFKSLSEKYFQLIK